MLQRVFRFTAALALVGALSLPLGAAELPRASLGYIFTTHQEPIMVAMAKGEAFEPLGAYLKPVVDKERYDLFVDGAPVARISIVVTKSGSEMATLFAQNHL
ncbi:MAG TPA: ABC transporter substrate-binding protein, partial [Synergistales bacterium]|nr:ABC transporter substrate-binding protein [Synergistales bacterium]